MSQNFYGAPHQRCATEILSYFCGAPPTVRHRNCVPHLHIGPATRSLISFPILRTIAPAQLTERKPPAPRRRLPLSSPRSPPARPGSLPPRRPPPLLPRLSAVDLPSARRSPSPPSPPSDPLARRRSPAPVEALLHQTTTRHLPVALADATSRRPETIQRYVRIPFLLLLCFSFLLLCCPS